MLHSEFEELTGETIDPVAYKTIIEPMYMAIPDWMTKGQFISMLDIDYIRTLLSADKISMCRSAARLLKDLGFTSDDLPALECFQFGSDKWKAMYHLRRLLRCME